MPIDSAIELIQKEAGKALDPAVVEAFVRVLPQIRAQVEAGLQTGLTANRIPVEGDLSASAKASSGPAGAVREAWARRSASQKRWRTSRRS
jgi:hypothetical protein